MAPLRGTFRRTILCAHLLFFSRPLLAKPPIDGLVLFSPFTGVADCLNDPELEADMRAAAFVSHGGMLQKWRKAGREKPHRRFVRVACGMSSSSGRRLQVELHWDKKSDVVVRADDEIYESCFQGDGSPTPNAFQVILAKRMLFLVADSKEEQAFWVTGINAIACKGINQLQRDDERLGAEVEQHDIVAVHDSRTGSVYLRDFTHDNIGTATEYWIMSSRSAALGMPPLRPQSVVSTNGNNDEDGIGIPHARQTGLPGMPSFSSERQSTESGSSPSGGDLSLRAPTMTGHHGMRVRGDSLVADQIRLRDEHAARMIANAEEQARVYRDLQARVDAEDSKRRELEEGERQRMQQLEAERAQQRYEQELAAWEMAEEARQLSEATEQLQAALLTQDSNHVRSAIHRYAHVLQNGSDANRNDLSVAKSYLEQLEQAASAAASEYNSSVQELHQLTYTEVDQFDAEVLLGRLQAVAERAEAAGAPAEMLEAAQQKANHLYSMHVELLRAKHTAEAQLTDCTRALASLGMAAIEPLRATIQHAAALGLTGPVAEQASATLAAAEEHEVNRSAAEAEVRRCMGLVESLLASHASSGQVLRHFDAAEALRSAIQSARSCGVDQGLLYEASHQLSPIEAAEREHHYEVSTVSTALHNALQHDSEQGLEASMAQAKHIRPYIHTELYETADKRLDQFKSARELAVSSKELKEVFESAEGAEGAAPLRKALRRAEAAGMEGLIVRKAATKLAELTELEEARDREVDAMRWMEQQAQAKREEAERRKVEEAAKEEAKEARRAERRKEKEMGRQRAESEAADGNGNDGEGEDYLARAAEAQAWESHTAPDGREYYHNTLTMVTTWKRPPEMDASVLSGKSAGEKWRSAVAASTTEGRWRTACRAAGMALAAEETERDSQQMAMAASASSPGTRGVSSASIGSKEEKPIERMGVKGLRKFLRQRGVGAADDESLDQGELLVLAQKHRNDATVIWQRTKAADGRFYYFNALTKATSWTKPENLYASSHGETTTL